MEKCIVTSRLLAEDQVITTYEGPVASFLWGKNPIKTDRYGVVLLPVSLLQKVRASLGRDPAPDALEDGGRCLGTTQ